MDEIKDVLAANLRALRRARSLTQLELAEKLHYSDKSVSKWEHGDAVPDIEVIACIAAFYGVTVDFLITPHADDEPAVVPPAAAERQRNIKRLMIALLATLAVWLIATVIYVQFFMWTALNVWSVFIWAIPASCIVLIVFNALWGKRPYLFVLVSVLIWSAIAAVYIQWLALNMWMMFLIGVPLQAAVVLWAKLAQK